MDKSLTFKWQCVYQKVPKSLNGRKPNSSVESNNIIVLECPIRYFYKDFFSKCISLRVSMSSHFKGATRSRANSSWNPPIILASSSVSVLLKYVFFTLSVFPEGRTAPVTGMGGSPSFCCKLSAMTRNARRPMFILWERQRVQDTSKDPTLAVQLNHQPFREAERGPPAGLLC